MKGGLIGTYVYLVFQKPFRENPSSKTSHSRSRAAASRQKWENDCHKDPPLAMPLASVLVTICLLLWMVQNAITTNKSDSPVGGNNKRMTLPPLSSSYVGSYSRRVISPSLTTPNFSVRRRMMPSPPSKAAFPLALPAPLSAPYGDAHRASYAKTQKESQDPRDRKSSLRNAPRHRPCHRHHALWE